jgi:hypothetical protein
MAAAPPRSSIFLPVAAYLGQIFGTYLRSSIKPGGDPEIAEVVVADTALRVLEDVLAYEHPCIDDPAEDDPPTLLAGRRLAHAARGLRAELRRYRRAVLDVRKPETDELPV